jgi:hypothetical protein
MFLFCLWVETLMSLGRTSRSIHLVQPNSYPYFLPTGTVLFKQSYSSKEYASEKRVLRAALEPHAATTAAPQT